MLQGARCGTREEGGRQPRGRSGAYLRGKMPHRWQGIAGEPPRSASLASRVGARGKIAPHVSLNRSKTAPIASSGENVAMQHSGLLPHSPPDQVTWQSARHQMPSRRGQLPIAAGCSGAFLFFIGTLFRLIEAIRDFSCLHILSKRECFTG
jgi:hypothetical protein